MEANSPAATAAPTAAEKPTSASASGPPPPSSSSSIFSNILFRNVCPTDLPAIYALERQSYPKDEAASKSQIQYRQHHAAPFFRCAVYIPPQEEEDNNLPSNDGEKKEQQLEEKEGGEIANEEQPGQQQVQQSSSWSITPTTSKLTGEVPGPVAAPMSIPSTNKTINNNSTANADASHNSLNAIGTIIGFVTATRCHAFTEKSMKVHDPSGNLLAIHSVVIKKEYRGKGIGKAMMDNYIQVIEGLMERKWMKDVENKKLAGGGGVSSGVGGTSSIASSTSSKTQQKTYIHKIVLMSKIANIPFYVKLGFQVLGKSSIVHGEDEWYDCSKQLECTEKVQLQLKEQQQLQRNRNSSLCWIVDSFAIPLGNGGGGRRQRGNSTVGFNNVEIAATASAGAGVANVGGTNANASAAIGNLREGTVANASLGGGGGSSIGSGSSNSAVSYTKGSGNPAAVVMVPNATPMSKMKRTPSFNQLHLLGLVETTSTSNSNDASNFDPIFEDNISWMKHVAKEFNLSETAFIWKCGQPTSSTDVSSFSSSKKTDEVATSINISNSSGNAIHYNIRFYTCNGTEIDLCGHATLAASSVIFQRLAKEGMNNNNNTTSGAGRGTSNNTEEIIFHAKNDVTLKAKLNTNNGMAKNSSSNSANIGGGNTDTGISTSNHRNLRSNQPSLKIDMEFPTKKVIPFEKGADKYSGVVTMLKESLYSQSNEAVVEEFIEFVGIDDAGDDLLIELTPEGFSNVPRYMEDISLKPMLEFGEYNRGVIICCEVSDEYHLYGETADFMSRFFGPKAGIEEDPVTGSAHCILGPYYGTKLGKSTIVGAQKSLRGGIVECQIKSDEVIRIAGAAVTTMSGNLYI